LRSSDFAAAPKVPGIQHRFTRAYRSQANGKAERFVRSAIRDWAYCWTYRNPRCRTLTPKAGSSEELRQRIIQLNQQAECG